MAAPPQDTDPDPEPEITNDGRATLRGAGPRAKSPVISDQFDAAARLRYATALRNAMEYPAQKVQAFIKILQDDPEHAKAIAPRFLEEWKQVTGNTLMDTATADVLAQVIGTAYVQGASKQGAEITNDGPEDEPRDDKGQWIEMADEHWGGTPPEMHERAEGVMRSFDSANHPQIGNVKFTRDGRDKTLYSLRTPHEFQSVQAIPQVVEKGRLVSSEPDRGGNPDIVAFHKIEHGVKIGGVPYTAQVTVKQTRSGQIEHQKFYLHRLTPQQNASSPYNAGPMSPPGRGPAGT